MNKPKKQSENSSKPRSIVAYLFVVVTILFGFGTILAMLTDKQNQQQIRYAMENTLFHKVNPAFFGQSKSFDQSKIELFSECSKQENDKIVSNIDILYNSKEMDQNTFELVQKITFILDSLNIKSNLYAGSFLSSFNSNSDEYFKDVKLENIKDFMIFKLTIGEQSYTLKQLDENQMNRENMLRATEYDHPNLLKIFSAFNRKSTDQNGSKSTWVLTEYLDSSVLDDYYIKQGGIPAVRLMAKDLLKALKYLHEEKKMAGITLNFKTVGETTEMKNGKSMTVYKFLDSGIELISKDLNAADFAEAAKKDLSLLGNWVTKLCQHSNDIGTITYQERLAYYDFVGACQRSCYSENPAPKIDELLKHSFFN